MCIACILGMELSHLLALDDLLPSCGMPINNFVLEDIKQKNFEIFEKLSQSKLRSWISQFMLPAYVSYVQNQIIWSLFLGVFCLLFFFFLFAVLECNMLCCILGWVVV